MGAALSGRLVDALEQQCVEGFVDFGWALVFVLLGSCGPSKIAGKVSLIIINAGECTTVRLRTEVLVDVVAECPEIVNPLWGYRDSPAAIILESSIFGFEATCFYVAPINVKG
jgi:hypothetical protein